MYKMSEHEIAELKEEINNNTELIREFNRKRKKEIVELQEWNKKAKTILGRILSKLFKKVFTLNHNALINTRLTKEQIEKETKAFMNILGDSKINREILQEFYKHKINKGEFLIRHVQIHLDDSFDNLLKDDDSEVREQIKEDVEYIKNDLKFYKKQLERLNLKGEKN
jgi:hypothetical protein